MLATVGFACLESGMEASPMTTFCWLWGRALNCTSRCFSCCRVWSHDGAPGRYLSQHGLLVQYGDSRRGGSTTTSSPLAMAAVATTPMSSSPTLATLIFAFRGTSPTFSTRTCTVSISPSGVAASAASARQYLQRLPTVAHARHPATGAVGLAGIEAGFGAAAGSPSVLLSFSRSVAFTVRVSGMSCVMPATRQKPLRAPSTRSSPSRFSTVDLFVVSGNSRRRAFGRYARVVGGVRLFPSTEYTTPPSAVKVSLMWFPIADRKSTSVAPCTSSIATSTVFSTVFSAVFSAGRGLTTFGGVVVLSGGTAWGAMACGDGEGDAVLRFAWVIWSSSSKVKPTGAFFGDTTTCGWAGGTSSWPEGA
eukprot:Sspe_Gene.81678::Locus_52667_Transcript_1_1_Confidence_1.000_Length_1715::g.81678::m.81678